MWVSKLKNMRWAAMILGTANSVVLIVGSYFLILGFPSCDRYLLLLFVALPFLAALRIGTMVKTGITQEATAKTIIEKSPADTSNVVEDVFRPERRVCIIFVLWFIYHCLVVDTHEWWRNGMDLMRV